VIRRDSPARSVFFIASGAVEMDMPGGPVRIGRGEIFGQVAILLRKPRRAEVRAIAPSTLLVLDEGRFLKLLRASPRLQQAVHDSAATRGADPDALLEGLGIESAA
jgi:CPA1 family monovalent cation:H+ antiporter